jgi:hypothetical protein
MDDSQDYWQRQDPDKPLYPDMLWARPEQRSLGGKLLIIGGHKNSFALVAKAYETAQQAQAGSLHVLLPDTLKKTVENFLPVASYASSNISGSYAQSALDIFLMDSDWADGVLLAGDFGKNSETAIVLEKFTQKYKGRLVMSDDAIDFSLHSPLPILDRTDTTIVLSLSQFQQLYTTLHPSIAITSKMGLTPLVNILHKFTLEHPVNILVGHDDMIIAASNGQVDSIMQPPGKSIELVKVASHAAVWWIQNPAKVFEALSCAVISYTRLRN